MSHDLTASWTRVGRDRPCLVCGRVDWCLRASDDGASICARVAAGATRQVTAAGWLHHHRQIEAWPRSAWLSVKVSLAKPRSDLESLASEFREAVDPGHLAGVASRLGLSASSLKRLGIGWCKQSSAWAFPMTDVTGSVRGIRLRTWKGKKFAIRGGREGLFIPSGLESDGTLLIAEGPTDTAALLDLGFSAIGRPSCHGGSDLLVDLVRRYRPDEVVIVSDNDKPGPDGSRPGQDGALALAMRLVSYVARLRLITPPYQVKDARAWLRSNATHESVLQVIDVAERFRVRAHAFSIPRRTEGGTHG
ncbi:Uncharacterized domain associated with phage/plasmid primase [Singulisphaera sp. GP187]|nr:Uncharacterized domain associated with phage/plasmid primase [Singulisphaera sp. GP187]